MALTYIQAISKGFPAVQCQANGTGSVYTDLVWDSGDQIPSKDLLDTWIAANPQITGLIVTKFEFRKLFTITERVAIDNVQTNTAIPAAYRAILLTIAKDMELSAEVHLYNSDVLAGLNLLEQIGLIGPGRAAIILTGQAPA